MTKDYSKHFELLPFLHQRMSLQVTFTRQVDARRKASYPPPTPPPTPHPPKKN